MQRIGRILTAILLLPVLAAGAAWLMDWPGRDKLYYVSIGWVVGWTACYLAARMVVWVIARFVPPAETGSPHLECGASWPST
jgi:uncharacterized membrane-anchored protein